MPWIDSGAARGPTGACPASRVEKIISAVPAIWILRRPVMRTSSELSRGGLYAERIVDRLDEHGRGPRTGVGAVARVVVGGHPGGLDLRERNAPVLHRLDAVAHDHRHVAVFHHLVLVAEVTVTRHDVGAAFALMSEHREVQDVVQRANQ